MKLSKQVKADLAKAYQCAMEISILDMKAPLRYVNQYIAENVSGFGTAADEKVQSREDYRKMLMKSRQQSKGMLFKAKIITPYRPKFTDETTAQFHNEIVVQIGDKKNKHTLHLCFSTVFKYQHNKWQMVLFHGSMPDAASSTEDTFHVGEAEKKLKELEQVVAQRTAELLTKTRGLEIEASLERVRAVTMGMNTPSDILNICKVFFNELQALGFKDLRNTLINFWDDANGQLHDYDYSDFSGGNFAKLAYSSHPAFEEFQKKIRKAKDAFAKLVINKDGLKSWKQRRRNSGEYKDPRLNKISALYYYFYSTGVGALGISTFSPISKEEVEVLKKFRNVFDMAYQRYVDIQKSAAQSREAQIEVALERIRAASLAMMDSSALSGIIYKLYGELTKLDAKLDRCFIMIVNPENKGITWWMAGQEGLLAENGFFVQMNEHPTHLMYLNYCKQRKKKWTYLFQGKEKRDWDRFGFSKTELAKLPEPVKKFMAAAKQVHLSGSSDEFGSLVTGSFEPLPEEQQDIISRFTIAFNQAYIRFLDLQKAEVQAREAQIETALERVRSRTMGMQQSNELPEAANVLFQQVQSLGMPAWSAGYCIWDDDLPAGQTGKQGITLWMSSEGVMQPSFHAPLTKDLSFIHMREAYEKGQTFHVEEVGGKALVKHYKYMRTLPVVGKILDSIIEAGHPLPTFQIFHCVYFSQGFLLFITYEPVPEAHEIFKRFGKVFDQTYTRFLDLQKAEAQAREAQIEAALERVRSRSMAMHKSEELREVIQLVFEQFRLLNFKIDSAQFDPNYKETDDFNMWTAVPGQPYSVLLHIPYFDNPGFNGMKEAKKRGLSFITQHLSFEEKNQFFRHFFQHFKHIPAERQKLIFDSPGMYRAVVFMENVSLAIQNYSNTPYTEEENEVLKRFGKTFEQVYTRFLDLQKAEAQSREAQIELALERVRARTMAMQHSDELREAVLVIYEQLQELDFASHACNIIIIDKDTLDMQFWVSGFTQEIYPESYHIPRLHHTYHEVQIAAWQQGVKYQVFEYSGKRKIDFDKIFFTKTDFKNVPEDAKKVMIELKSLKLSTAFFNYGALQVLGAEELSDDKAKTLQRFAKVFEQTYTRFLDLQKAEAQAKEAQIEAALERVRSRALAMHTSREIFDVTSVLREQMGLLGQPLLEASVIHLYDSKSGLAESWHALRPAILTEGEIIYGQFQFEREDCELTKIFFNCYQSGQQEYTILAKGQQLKDWVLLLFEKSPDIKKYWQGAIPEFGYHHFSTFAGGALLAVTGEEISDEVRHLQKRAASVFELAYKRYLDLQKAEEQTKEAQIETALEKVRSRTMAMQSSNELQETATVLFNEFKKLGTEDIYQVTIGIYNEDEGVIDFRVTSWAGSGAQENRSFKLDMNEPTVLQPSVQAWKANKKSLVIDLTGEALEGWLNYRNKMSGITVSSSDTAGRRVITVAYYSKGHLSISTPVPVPADTLRTLERFAAVFDSTYTRFLDLKKAEAQAFQAEQDLIAIKEAKQKAEDALTELQSTQKQLIQSEKMASLGELTAGIAHEIQNPLNFVNNFSEVSKELLDEMKEAIEKGDTEEAKDIMNDVIQNLEKINHHGKRADGIVKGMLQHSRSSSNQKEATDINALADEYLRLAYHGLRAKDKSFNATMITDFDKTIGNINIVPQDIGRVILNLITNAFYAVSTEALAKVDGEYTPTVSVSTKKEGNQVLVSVKDNGNGIPQKILDKIFQPFFTTKPTGQGTGLGLSLSYDIVKAHGGELKVETKEGEGSTFIITLPA